MNYRYLSEAHRELDRQIGIYEEKDAGLGLEFLDEIESTISRVMELPKAWTEIETGIRRCLTNRFPYGVLYHFLEDKQEILIVAIMHTRQQPGYWESRKF